MLVRTLQENKTRILLPQFLQNTELFLECVFAFLAGVADRSEFTSGYSLLFGAIKVLYIPLWKNMFLLCATCPCDCIQLGHRLLMMRHFLTLRVQVV